MQIVSRIPLYLLSLLAMLMGAGVGLVLGPKAAVLGQFSAYLVETIKWIAIPLIFFSIVETVSHAHLKGKAVAMMFLVSSVNGTFAILIALLISNLFGPGYYFVLPPSDILERRIEQPQGFPIKMLLTSPIFISIFLGLAVGFILYFGKTERTQKIKAWIPTALKTTIRWVGYILLFLPIAIFGSVAKVVGLYGFGMMGGLLAYLAATIGGMVLQIGFIYQFWIFRVGKIPLKHFWKEALSPVIHSFGINSSLATLPVTLATLKRLNISEASARVAACIGTNFNNDGILLYEVVAVFFLAQAHGMELSIVQQLTTASICVFATVGVAGVPEAGVIALSLVAASVGLPVESISLLLTVDWIVARCRSATNVVSDLTVAIGVEALTQLPADNKSVEV